MILTQPHIPTPPAIPAPELESIPGVGPLVLRLSKYERGAA